MKRFKINKKYVLLAILVVGFLSYMLFFDQNNLAKRREIIADIEDLKNMIQYYQDNIIEDSALIENLKDDKFLERYARENFLMKREGETIIVIEDAN